MAIAGVSIDQGERHEKRHHRGDRGIGVFGGLRRHGGHSFKAFPPLAKPKAPYHIEFATGAAKPNPAGVTIPGINYTAVTKTLEKRAVLLVRLDAPGGTNDQPAMNQMIMGPVDIPDPVGSLPSELHGIGR